MRQESSTLSTPTSSARKSVSGSASQSLPTQQLGTTETPHGTLSLTLTKPSKDSRGGVHLADANVGVVATKFVPDSLAEKAGMQAGDILVSINGEPVTSRDHAVALLSAAEGDVALVVSRALHEERPPRQSSAAVEKVVERPALPTKMQSSDLLTQLQAVEQGFAAAKNYEAAQAASEAAQAIGTLRAKLKNLAHEESSCAASKDYEGAASAASTAKKVADDLQVEEARVCKQFDLVTGAAPVPPMAQPAVSSSPEPPMADLTRSSSLVKAIKEDALGSKDSPGRSSRRVSHPKSQRAEDAVAPDDAGTKQLGTTETPPGTLSLTLTKPSKDSPCGIFLIAAGGRVSANGLKPDGLAAKAGMQTGDILVSINGQPVASTDHAVALLSAAEGDVALVLSRKDEDLLVSEAV